MKEMTFKPFIGTFALLALCLAALAFTPKKGLDSYEIYLNERLIMKQFINQPLNLRTLKLENASAQDELWIRYTHCNFDGAGSQRSLVLKDGKGHILKQWEFADTSGKNNPMMIKVGELLQMEKEHKDHRLSLYYRSKELPGTEMLAFVQVD